MNLNSTPPLIRIFIYSFLLLAALYDYTQTHKVFINVFYFIFFSIGIFSEIHSMYFQYIHKRKKEIDYNF